MLTGNSPAGIGAVARRATPPRIRQPEKGRMRPRYLQTRGISRYAGISTAPAMAKFKYGLPPKLDVLSDSP